jgi:predicted dehydrogenase
VRVGLIGAGSMGGRHARVVAGSPGAVLDVVVDADVERARSLTDTFGGRAAADVEAAFSCDAVIVASTTATHADVALAMIAAGRPVLVEKPLSEDYAAAQAVVAAARAADVPLMCGFVERFNAVVTTLHSLIDEPPVHALSVRHSPQNPRTVSGVEFDLLIHDVDIILRLNGDREIRSVVGATWTPPGYPCAEVADCTIRFDDTTMASLSASRAGQRKVRTIQVDTGMSLYELDLLRQNLTVYRHIDQSMTVDGSTYRADTVVDIPFVRHTGEPLALQLAHFLGLLSSDSVALEAERTTILPPHRVVAQLAHD